MRIAFLGIIWFMPTLATAEIQQFCSVQFERGNTFPQDWSSEYGIVVDFLSGHELNSKTSSLRYSTMSAYAQLWFGHDKVATIKVDASIVRPDLTREDLERTFLLSSDVSGRDFEGKKWRLTCKEPFGGFLQQPVIGVTRTGIIREEPQCDEARRSCRSSCSAASIHDSDYEFLFMTDFERNCQTACELGFYKCQEHSDILDACTGFTQECKSKCPRSVFDYSAGDYVPRSNARLECNSACQSGAYQCQ